jgi:predicted AlkP superfamily pyrophosphatase or phosphodiesterase
MDALRIDVLDDANRVTGWPRYGMSRPGSTQMLSGEGSSAEVAYSQVPAGTVARLGTLGTG